MYAYHEKAVVNIENIIMENRINKQTRIRKNVPGVLTLALTILNVSMIFLQMFQTKKMKIWITLSGIS